MTVAKPRMGQMPYTKFMTLPEAEAMRRHLTELLRDEVDRAFAEQEALST